MEEEHKKEKKTKIDFGFLQGLKFGLGFGFALFIYSILISLVIIGIIGSALRPVPIK
jgi:hypothetical protein